MKYIKPILVIVLVLLADQVFKVWIKTHMSFGETRTVLGNWFFLHFTENNGIAFGLEIGGIKGKVILTLFRIFASIVIGYFLIKIIKDGYPTGFAICIALIFAGAVGNIIDSVIYGVIYDYAPLLQGKVVDMLYFPIIKGHYADWIPVIGGKYFLFFRPVFNLSDTSITTGVFSILLFYRKYLKSF